MNSLKKIVLSTLILVSIVSNSQTKINQNMSLYTIEINSLDGKPIHLNDYKGKYILFVNVASECGFTGQYEDLQKLYDTYQDKLMVIGVPCNQFGSQEPGTADQIQSFCSKNYGVTFLMTEKINVKGELQHPLYKWLTNKELNGVKSTSVKWNFQKYLVDDKTKLCSEFLKKSLPLRNFKIVTKN
jgi:glutathione peroxidase